MAQIIKAIPDNIKKRDDEILLASIKPSLMQSWPSWLLAFVGIFLLSYVMGLWFGSTQIAAHQLSRLLPFSVSPELHNILFTGVILVVSLWKPSLQTWRLATTKFEITTRRILYTWGLLTRHHDQIELARVRDIRVTRPLHLRLIRQGTVEIHTVDRQIQRLPISGLHDPMALKNLIHQLNLIERERLGYREVEASQYFR